MQDLEGSVGAAEQYSQESTEQNPRGQGPLKISGRPEDTRRQQISCVIKGQTPYTNAMLNSLSELAHIRWRSYVCVWGGWQRELTMATLESKRTSNGKTKTGSWSAPNYSLPAPDLKCMCTEIFILPGLCYICSRARRLIKDGQPCLHAAPILPGEKLRIHENK